MKPFLYNSLLEDKPPIAESKTTYSFLTERHLQAIWYEQTYFQNLPIEILSPGIWNVEAGPDFKKAHIKIGSHHLRGDIEIHFTDENWTQHQHHLDPRYDQVILHVSLWKSAHPIPILNSQQQPIHPIYLEDHLTTPLSRIEHLIDLDLYPYKKFVGSGQCAHSLFERLDPHEITELFTQAAEWRLEKKREFLVHHIEDPQQLISSGIAQALGYKQNAISFLNLYQALQSIQRMDEETLFGTGLALAGFFQKQFQRLWSESDYYQTLYSRFGDIPQKFPMQLAQIRPMNHPVRRLAYLTKMIKHPSTPLLMKELLQEWDFNWQNKKWKELQINFQNLIPSFEDSYWNFHFTFQKEPLEEAIPLMGTNLKNEIVINTFLPFLYHHIISQSDLSQHHAFKEFYFSFTHANTRKTKYLTHRFFGDKRESQAFKKAYFEQGSYQLHRDFCMHYESSCLGCPFVKRYKQSCNLYE